MAAPMRTVLVAKQPLIIRVLRECLALAPCVDVVAEVMTADEVIPTLLAQPADLVLLNPDRFPNAGIDIAETVRKNCPHVKLVIVSQRTEIDIVLAYANLGVMAYYPDDDLAQLSQDLEAIAMGRLVIGRHLVSDLMRLFDSSFGRAALSASRAALPDAPHPDSAHPTGPQGRGDTRLGEVLRLVGQGLTNKEIAHALGISQHTVVEHLRRLRARVGPVPRVVLARMLDKERGA